MNYYNPNFYSNYQYPNTQYSPQTVPVQSQPPQVVGLNGKVVDGEDVVRASEVPIGSYGVFPKADLSEIYVKTWNNNGTISIITFKPIEQKVPEPQEKTEIKELFDKINGLDAKIDAILNNNSLTKESKKEVMNY